MTANNPETIVAILIFAVFYLGIILRKTAQARLDLFDLVMLSTAATIPTLFAISPEFGYIMSTLTGVAFPFVALFGLLLAVLFIFIHRLAGRVHALEHDNRLLIQELSLLRQEAKNTVHGDKSA